MEKDLRVSASPRRGDIQGLRAVAVGLVVVYHFFPEIIPGGFVGVDVFFVISGFLITSLLLKEIERTGRISLGSFYARRLRRLMPASITVTIVTVFVASFMLGPLELAGMFTDAAWATAYLANFHLAQTPDGYFASADPSLFTHFWSLAVEEQYYFVWPLVLIGVVFAFRARWRTAAMSVLALLLLASLTASIALTASGSTHAYYSLGTRAWELAIGGAVAFITLYWKLTPPRIVTTAAAFVGLAAVAAAAFGFNELTPFPGWVAAVPTLGTALIIWAGFYFSSWLAVALSLAPIKFVGDISYSLYLWHWPVMVLGLPLVRPGNAGKVFLVGLSVLLAVATYFAIEQGLSRIKPALQTRRVVAVGVTASLAAVLAFSGAAAAFPTTGGPAIASAGLAKVNATVQGDVLRIDPSVGRVDTSWVPENVEPSLRELPDDLADVFYGCMGFSANTCSGGDPDGERVVVLAGDSQAGHLWPAVNEAATKNGWKLYGVAKSGCPLAMIAITAEQEAASSPGCLSWRSTAVGQVSTVAPDLILFANRGYGYDIEAGAVMTATQIADWEQGVNPVLKDLTDIAPVIYFGRFPTAGQGIESCLLQNLRAVSKCSTELDAALPAATRARDAELALKGGAVYFDPSTLVCDDECPLMDGNRIIYRDRGHLTSSYSIHLAPALAAVISAGLDNR